MRRAAELVVRCDEPAERDLIRGASNAFSYELGQLIEVERSYQQSKATLEALLDLVERKYPEPRPATATPTKPRNAKAKP